MRGREVEISMRRGGLKSCFRILFITKNNKEQQAISPFFQNYLNPQFRTNEIANSNVYQLLSSRLASRIINKLYVSAEGL